MYNKLQQTKQQWCGYSDIIDYWLRLRHDLIVNYSQVAGLFPDTEANQQLPSEEKLNAFYASLIDYICAGHFKIHEMILARWQSDGLTSNQEIDTLYQQIIETTPCLVSFNDKYSDQPLADGNFISFDDDISRAGEILEIRFEREDKMITLIANSLVNSA